MISLLNFIVLLAVDASKEQILNLPKDEKIPIAYEHELEGLCRPKITIDSDDNIYIITVTESKYKLLISRDHGKSFESHENIMEDLWALSSFGGPMQYGPRIGVDSNKKIYISGFANQEKVTKQSFKTCNLYFVSSTDSGATFSSPIKINDQPFDKAMNLHSMAVTPEGKVHFTWLNLPAKPDNYLFYSKIDNPESGRSDPIKFEGSACGCCSPDIVTDKNGNPIIAYRGGGSNDKDTYIVYSRDGGKSFSTPIRINDEDSKVRGCIENSPVISSSPDRDKFAVAWLDLRNGNKNVYWDLISKPQSGPDKRASKLVESNQGLPAIAIDNNDNVYCVWTDKRYGDFSIFLSSTNKKFKKELPISKQSDGTCWLPVIACGADFAVISYEQKKKNNPEKTTTIIKIISTK
ncbi:MAG: exo-alpha-sialidase [Planctomycetes bacterium]|nr:exo-alpha-sialidase [Planctomycetota bacterium]